MYSKTRLGSDQIDGALSLSPRGKRIADLIVAVVVAACVAVAAWSAVSHDTYATSGNGCVSVTVSSSTGGGVLHYCGESGQVLLPDLVRRLGPGGARRAAAVRACRVDQGEGQRR